MPQDITAELGDFKNLLTYPLRSVRLFLMLIGLVLYTSVKYINTKTGINSYDLHYPELLHGAA